ncbi:toxin [Candidatus Curtissbacteria bacterium]|nr:toxin [Candidatus Curtissbacteria bacterium]
MKYFDWDERKNLKLKIERGIGFDDVQVAIEEGKLLDTTGHPNKKKYPNQKMFVVEIGNYAYLVPFVEDEEKIFLKTIFPSRKATKKYLFQRKENK